MTFQPAVRRNVPLLIGIAGPSGGGKTLSALRIAKGLSGGKPFAFIDTERGRSLEYADHFEFLHDELDAPFTPSRYAQKIAEAEALDTPVIVVDSMSHEHAGEGGVLDLHEEELYRLAGDDWKKRDTMKFSAWIKPKAEHKRLVAHLLRLRCHLIFCLRAEEKVDLVKNKQGNLEVRPKRTMAGHVGWIPVCGKDLPFELTLSLVVTPDAPGVPHPIKLSKQLRPFVPLDAPLDEKVGRALAEWAAGKKLPGAGGVEGARRRPAANSSGTSADAAPNVGAEEPVYRPGDENGISGQEVGLTAPGNEDPGPVAVDDQPEPADSDGAATSSSEMAGPAPGVDVGKVEEESLFKVPATVARHEDRG